MSQSLYIVCNPVRFVDRQATARNKLAKLQLPEQSPRHALLRMLHHDARPRVRRQQCFSSDQSKAVWVRTSVRV